MEREQELMLALRNPHEAYRRVDFDARIEGADPAQLVALCYEQASSALASALFANGAGDNMGKSQAITRALAAVTALQLGIRGQGGVADALRQFYGAARRTLLDCAVQFDAEKVAAIREDMLDIGGALGGAASSMALTVKQDS